MRDTGRGAEKVELGQQRDSSSAADQRFLRQPEQLRCAGDDRPPGQDVYRGAPGARNWQPDAGARVGGAGERHRHNQRHGRLIDFALGDEVVAATVADVPAGARVGGVALRCRSRCTDRRPALGHCRALREEMRHVPRRRHDLGLGALGANVVQRVVRRVRGRHPGGRHRDAREDVVLRCTDGSRPDPDGRDRQDHQHPRVGRRRADLRRLARVPGLTGLGRRAVGVLPPAVVRGRGWQRPHLVLGRVVAIRADGRPLVS
mmetsp:Transcript_66135/g.190851  ORF Transcript_66135/g.190851 Transcript_66135/m.190851 type:complete len:260 (+) Transcript_66135:308-1087(+)